MKALVGFAVLICGCNWTASPGEVKALESQVSALQGRIATLEQKIERGGPAERDRQVDMETCLVDADDAYWNYVKLNGRQKKGTEIWTAPSSVFSQAAQEKRNVIEACRVRFAQK